MAYSVDLRSRVIDFIQKGHMKKEASFIFHVGTATIERWVALLSQTGNLEKRRVDRTASIFESEKLNAYIKENPDALSKDVAEHFGGSITGAFYALKREKITLKKRALLQRERGKRT